MSDDQLQRAQARIAELEAEREILREALRRMVHHLRAEVSQGDGLQENAVDDYDAARRILGDAKSRASAERGLASIRATVAAHSMTPEQREAQRRSFVFGNANISNERVTKETIDAAAIRAAVASKRPTFEQLVARVPEPPTTGLASAEAAPDSAGPLELIRRMVELDDLSRVVAEHHCEEFSDVEYTDQYHALLNEMRAALRQRPVLAEETAPSPAPHEWSERRGLTVCSRCGMVRNRDRDAACRGEIVNPYLDKDYADRLRAAVAEMNAADPFDGADFYTTDEDAEEFTFATAQEALDDWLECRAELDEPEEATIRRLRPDGETVTVYAYRRWTPSEKWIQRTARDMLYRFLESDCEEILDPNAKDPDRAFLPGDAYDNARARLETWVRETMAVAKVWHCEQVAEREYTAEQVIAMLGAAE